MFFFRLSGYQRRAQIVLASLLTGARWKRCSKYVDYAQARCPHCGTPNSLAHALRCSQGGIAYAGVRQNPSLLVPIARHLATLDRLREATF